MEDNRKYIRLNSCFPVEFSLYFGEGEPASGEYQGFTSNVSEGGICLNVRKLSPQDEELILNKKANVSLNINIPLWAKPVSANGEIVWAKKEKKGYLVGIAYRRIKPEDDKKIISYARRLKWIPRLVSLILIILLLGLTTLTFYHIQARTQNESLIKKLVSMSEVKAGLEKSLNEIRVRRDMLEKKLSSSEENIESIAGEITDIHTKTVTEQERLQKELKDAQLQQKYLEDMIATLTTQKKTGQDTAYKVTESRLSKLNQNIELLEMELSEVMKQGESEIALLRDKLTKLEKENKVLLEELKITEEGEVSLEEQLAKARLNSGKIEKANVNKMLTWLGVHQTKKTGLVVSYEGDPKLKDWGFTYDEALASQVFLISGNIKRAKDILDFYNKKAQQHKGLYYNAYDVRTGSPTEYVVHSGPNIWLAISACQYIYVTKEKDLLPMVENIALKMISMQKVSKDGSIKGGPNVDWVSTEHNLDAYALFNMLYKITTARKYKDAASIALTWLKDVGYNKPEARFMRGRGDSTIATDTFSWAIAAIGPEVLAVNDMDPDGIMEFAEKECRVEAKFNRPEGRAVDVTGFDFAKAQNVGRGGIVSTEWTAQMIVAFNIMSDYYKDKHDPEKERIYRHKAEYYLAQLGKMAISSPSPTGQGEGCLPYASIDNVDTGHGWRVAKGRRTGSVAGTAYYVFAYTDHNPLSFDK